jgi:hypothetical protein
MALKIESVQLRASVSDSLRLGSQQIEAHVRTHVQDLCALVAKQHVRIAELTAAAQVC